MMMIRKSLKVQSTVNKVDHTMIVKASMMAVCTMAGHTFEIVADTCAEVNIISEEIVKVVGAKVDKTRTGANQVNKDPLNVIGMVMMEVFHGDYQWTFNALV